MLQPVAKPELTSTITCPECGYKKTELMSDNVCVFFYECEGCKARLKPRCGDCCVFCSYGSRSCPPKAKAKSAR